MAFEWNNKTYFYADFLSKWDLFLCINFTDRLYGNVQIFKLASDYSLKASQPIYRPQNIKPLLTVAVCMKHVDFVQFLVAPQDNNS